MKLTKEQSVMNYMKNNPNIRGIRVITTSSNFSKRFDGSINYFFKTLKNSLQSVNGVSNREFFRNLSGSYFSLDNSTEYDIIILYDKTLSELPEIQVKIRLKKLLGNQIQIQFGTIEDFKERLDQMIGIVRKSQVFGEYYKRSNNELIYTNR